MNSSLAVRSWTFRLRLAAHPSIHASGYVTGDSVGRSRSVDDFVEQLEVKVTFSGLCIEKWVVLGH